MEDIHHLLQPLITTPSSTTTITSSSKDGDCNSTIKSIIIRFTFVIFIAIISLWGNHEASKGFEISIINDASEIPEGRQFNLLYMSNDKITRIVIQTSEFAENILYPISSNESHRRNKRIGHVTIKLTGRNQTERVVVESVTDEEFVIHISHVLMGDRDVDKAIVSAVQRGIVRVWLWNDEEYGVPQNLMNGIEEYVCVSAGIIDSESDSGKDLLPELSDCTCWTDKNPVDVARILSYCERINSGFMGRLNHAIMNYQWLDLCK